MKQRKGQREGPVKHAGLTVGRPVLSDTLATEFVQFLEYHDAKQFSRNLRKMLIEFLMREGSLESVYLKDLLYDIEGLFELLDVIESEEEGAKSK